MIRYQQCKLKWGVDDKRHHFVDDLKNLMIVRKCKYLQEQRKLGYNSESVELYMWEHNETVHLCRHFFKWISTSGRTSRRKHVRRIMRNGYRVEPLWKDHHMIDSLTAFQTLLNDLDCLIVLEEVSSIHEVVKNVMIPQKRVELYEFVDKMKQQFFVMKTLREATDYEMVD